MTQLERHLLEQDALPDDYFWHEVRWRAVKSVLPASSMYTLVDVGAGAGRLGRSVQKELPRVRYRFIEPIDSLAARLASQYGEDARATLADVRDAKVVVLLDVLEHQEDDAAFLSGIMADARPGTTLILTVPALPHLWSAWDVELGHHRRYTKKTLRSAIAAAGLDLATVSYLFPELWPIAAARRIARPARRAAPDGGSEFRALPHAINLALTASGALGVRARRALPLGTSLIAVAKVADD